MADFGINEMLEMQRTLQERYLWAESSPWIIPAIILTEYIHLVFHMKKL